MIGSKVPILENQDKFNTFSNYEFVQFEEDWIKDSYILENVACPINISIPKELQKDLYQEVLQIPDDRFMNHLAVTLNNERVKIRNYGFKRFGGWPDSEKFDKLSKYFDVLEGYNHRRIVYWTHPDKYVRVHSDSPSSITSTAVLYITLGPENIKYRPMEIYHDDNILLLRKKEMDLENVRIYVWNSCKLHGVFNNEFERVNAQIRLTMTYEEFVSKFRDLIDV